MRPLPVFFAFRRRTPVPASFGALSYRFPLPRNLLARATNPPNLTWEGIGPGKGAKVEGIRWTMKERLLSRNGSSNLCQFAPVTLPAAEAGDATAQQELPSYCPSPVSGATDDGSLLSSEDAEAAAMLLFTDPFAQAPHLHPQPPLVPQQQQQQQHVVMHHSAAPAVVSPHSFLPSSQEDFSFPAPTFADPEEAQTDEEWDFVLQTLL